MATTDGTCPAGYYPLLPCSQCGTPVRLLFRNKCRACRALDLPDKFPGAREWAEWHGQDWPEIAEEEE